LAELGDGQLGQQDLPRGRGLSLAASLDFVFASLEIVASCLSVAWVGEKVEDGTGLLFDIHETRKR